MAAPGSFELTGGHLCLDLANTLEDRPKPQSRERLRTYADLLDWSEEAGALTAGDVRRLRREARCSPQVAHRALTRARHVREILFLLFTDVARGRRVGTQHLGALNQALKTTLPARRVERARTGFMPGWASAGPRLDRMLWPVLSSAIELLTTSQLDRVRICAADACAWLFIDRSRRGIRRWCDMKVCGNRAKARRHYLKTRGA